jgi:hypothetical protein
MGRFLDASADHRERLDRLPGRVEQALVKALAIRPADRFATPGAFAAALAAAATRGPPLADAQVDTILRRAAELDLAQPTEPGALSIGGVEQVAAQVGIPPERVRDAARELARAPAPVPAVPAKRHREFFPSRLVIERLVDGHIPPSAYESIAQQIQDTFGVVGVGSTLGRSLTWTGMPGGGSGRDVRIAITPEGDGTRIHVEEHLELRGLAKAAPGLGAAIAGSLGAVIAGLLGGGDAAGIGMLVGAALGIPGAIRFVLVTQEMHRQPELEQLADRLAARVERGLPTEREQGNGSAGHG